MPEMTARERYQAVMHFQPGVRTLLWEFAYWNGALDRWYREGLRRTSYSLPPGLPDGGITFAEGLICPPWGGLGFYRDWDVHNALGLDDGILRLPVNWRPSPPYEVRVLEEDETTKLIIDAGGVTARVRKNGHSLPQYLDAPVRDRATWEQVREERFGPDILSRFPMDWETSASAYRNRDCPLGLSLVGFFCLPRELLGLTRQLMMYYDDPRLMHDMNHHIANLWLAMLEEIPSKVQLDSVYIGEDMAYKNGPHISPAMFREFMLPHYKRLTGFLKARGVDVIFVDTDGDCHLLIPLLLEGGVTGLYPMEVQAGMDVVEVRKQYPRLLIQGGLDKKAVAKGREAIEAELGKLPFMLAQGGYIPYVDHAVPADVSWDNFRYYRQRVNECVQRFQSE